ncbi:MAG: DUF1127 domain-containing protein [Pseudolabrys sp.]
MTLQSIAARLRSLAGRIGGAIQRYHHRRAAQKLLLLDDYILRDIGIRRGDILACLSSPWEDPVEYLEERRARQRAVKAMPAAEIERLAA